ncbi:M48 family metalloprotease [Marinomonas sp. 15G1-11]|uniref:M48 family metalloprotease n=1 Tax=Marinomonas phaeophyticola TaxID=3004091 RepID=A0ABT4JPQ5_9GAMM|nr:M48 family metalloprotease [Marinomonas sp. 15G1-11]MCZ2720210.1 M48 family metalloprotease [Marinomonas sp. 15G1-11]
MPSLQKSLSERSLDNPSYVLGQYWFRQLNGSRQLIDFPPAYDYLNESLSQLLVYTDLTDKHVEIGLLNSKTSNAFVMPGNHLFLYSDILQLLDSEEQFLALLAHEVAHLDAKHYERQQQNSLQEQQKVLALIGTSIALALAGSDMEAGSALWVGGIANHSENALSYSRSQEQEADRIGKQYLEKAGINKTAMNQLFLAFSKASPRGEQKEFLSTHPVPQNRASDSLTTIDPISILFKKENKAYQYFRATLLTYRSTLSDSNHINYLDHSTPEIKRYMSILASLLNGAEIQTELVEQLDESNEYESYLKAKVYIKNNQFNKATQLAKRKLSIDPKNITYSTLLSMANYEISAELLEKKPYQYQTNQKLDALIAIFKHEQNLPLTLAYLAQKNFNSGKTTEALSLLNRARKLANATELEIINRIEKDIKLILNAQEKINLPST